MLRIAATAAALLAIAAPALAQSYAVRFQNNSGYTIYSIQTSPDYDPNWGQDFLGGNVLGPGRYLDLTIHNVQSCYYDVRVVWTDGAETQTTWDICSNSTLYIN